MRLFILSIIFFLLYSCKSGCNTCPAAAKVPDYQKKIIRKAKKEERKLNRQQMKSRK